MLHKNCGFCKQSEKVKHLEAKLSEVDVQVLHEVLSYWLNEAENFDCLVNTLHVRYPEIAKKLFPKENV